MKKLIIICMLLALLSGCSVKPNEYPFENRNESIASVELLYYPWIADERKPFMEFQLIRTLTVDEIPEFMDKIYSLETKRVRPTPPSNYGLYIARVCYENGDTEYFGTRHIEIVKAGKEAYAVGYYVFTGDAFEKLFLEYAGKSDHLLG